MDDDLAQRVERAKAGNGRAFGELLSPVIGPAFRSQLHNLHGTMLMDSAGSGA